MRCSAYQRRLGIPVFLVLLSLFLFMLPHSAQAAEYIEHVSSADGLEAAVGKLKTGDTMTVYIEADFDCPSEETFLSVNAGTLTILGNGHTISNAAVFVAISGGEVNLGNADGGKASELTIKGNSWGSSPGLICLAGNGVCNMYDGVTLRDRKTNAYFGGGVTIGRQTTASNSAVFHMVGGTITNCGVGPGTPCFGGGVSVTKWYLHYGWR